MISRTCSRRLRQKIWRCGLFLQPPAVVAVVNHLPGHAAVYADVLARDEACLVATEEQHHVGNVHGVPHPGGRLLSGIRTLVIGVCRVYPAVRDGVHPGPARQTYRLSMCECGNATLGGGVALGLRLAHPIPGRGEIQNAAALRHIGRQEFAEVKGRGDTHC